jgi:ribonuclease P/MRP protein subunit RPP1
MAFYDYCVLADSGLPAVLKTAKELGWGGLCLIGKSSSGEGKKAGVDVVKGLLIETSKAADVRKEAVRNRKDYEIIAVRGLDESVNRAASETPEVDVLLPALGTGVDFKTAKFAGKNGVSVAFELTPLIHLSGEERGKAFSGMAENAKVVKRFGAPFVLCSGAMTEWDLRAPSELMAFGKAMGFEQHRIKESLSGGLVEKNRKKLGSKWISRGVEVE